MFEKEEEQLAKYKTMINHIDIPVNAIDDAILAGFQKAKAEERPKPRSKKWLISTLAAAIMFIGFFTSVRLSPAFADYMTAIPGMEKIIDLIRLDKGRMAAVENHYYEKIGASDEHDGMKFTVDGAIADEKGLVLFFTIKTEKKQDELLSLKDVHLKSLEGETLKEFTSSYGSPGESEEKNVYKGKIDYFFQNAIKSRNYQLDVDINNGTANEKYSVKFKLEKERKVKKTYEINKTITIEGQKIHFVDATVYPLRVAVHVKMDVDNSKQILNFDDIRLVDENGETWNKIGDGATASHISKDEVMVYLQSNYFREPKELYLVLEKIQAVDKDEVNLVIDLQNERIVKQPKGNILNNFKIEGNDLVFTMETKKPFHFFSFSKITDANGKEINSPSTYQTMTDDSAGMKMGINIPNLKQQASPISLELSFYPTWIEGHEKIRIK